MKFDYFNIYVIDSRNAKKSYTVCFLFRKQYFQFINTKNNLACQSEAAKDIQNHPNCAYCYTVN